MSKIRDFTTSYNQKNILGAVSQSGGIPTGAIIERGSNSNGAYVKYADGTMICTAFKMAGGPVNNAFGAIFKTVNNVWTFPIAFISEPQVSVTEAFGVGNCFGSLGDGAVTPTTTTWALSRAATTASTPSASLIAIGRWF